jgi:hypothetical protein
MPLSAGQAFAASIKRGISLGVLLREDAIGISGIPEVQGEIDFGTITITQKAGFDVGWAGGKES